MLPLVTQLKRNDIKFSLPKFYFVYSHGLNCLLKKNKIHININIAVQAVKRSVPGPFSIE